jgi:hypothetical protein
MTSVRHISLLVALAMILLSFAAGACGEEPVDIDAQALLAETSENMQGLPGFHLLYELHQPESAKRAEGVQKVDADFNAEGELQASVQYLASGALISIDVIALVDTHYVLYPISKDWSELDPAESPLTKLNLAEGPVRILDNITSATFIGVEKRVGERTYHLQGQVTKADIESIVGTVSTAEVFTADLWIGAEDSLLYEVDVAGPMTEQEPPGTWRSIILTNLGVTTDIKAPQ